MKSWVLGIFLAVVAVAPALVLIPLARQSAPEPVIASVQFGSQKLLEPGTTFDVRACKVLDGYRYEMYLEGGKWIEGHLAVATKDEANIVVIEWLNKTTEPPTITLLRQVGNYWIVNFTLTVDGKKANITDLLRAKGLLLERS